MAGGNGVGCVNGRGGIWHWGCRLDESGMLLLVEV